MQLLEPSHDQSTYDRYDGGMYKTGLCGTVVALDRNCSNWISVLLLTGLDFGAAAVSGGDILPLLCNIRKSVLTAGNNEYVGAVIEKW